MGSARLMPPSPWAPYARIAVEGAGGSAECECRHWQVPSQLFVDGSQTNSLRLCVR